MGGVVLMLAATDDGEAVTVAEVLRGRGVEVAWLDTGWFPGSASVSAGLYRDGWYGVIETPEATISLSRVASVYYRQPPPFVLPEQMTGPERRFATTEARFGLGGLLASIPARWVSHPSRVADAEYKPVQLAAAARCGLKAPHTLMTNDPDEAAGFIESAPRPGVVYKAIMHSLISESDEVKLIYTTPLDRFPGGADERIRLTMHQFQYNINKAFDVRLVATDLACFAIAIHTDDAGARQDWRTGYGALRYEQIPAPDDVAKKCRALLSSLGLRLGVFDFSVGLDGAWYYLEVNPAGQWAWLEDATGAPIAAAIADTLTANLTTDNTSDSNHDAGSAP